MQKPSNHIEYCANISAEMADLVEEVDSADVASGLGGAGTHPSDVGPEYLLTAEESGSHQPPHPLLDEVLVEHSEDICSFIAQEAVRGPAAGLCSSPVLSWGISAGSGTSPTQREGEWDINTFGSDNIRNGKRRKLAKLGVPIEPTLASEVRLLVLISLIYVHAEPCSQVWCRLDCDV